MATMQKWEYSTTHVFFRDGTQVVTEVNGTEVNGRVLSAAEGFVNKIGQDLTALLANLPEGHFRGYPDWIDYLVESGKRGWELAAFTQCGEEHPNHYEAIFKRPASEEAK